MTALRITPPGAPDSEVLLLPERAVYWPARATLLVADMHLGKSEAYRTLGAPIPEGVLDADLARLASALRATEAQRLIVLGDLLHAPAGLTDRMIARVAAWRGDRPNLEIVVLPGNHDRRLDAVQQRWGLHIPGPTLRDGPFSFCHDPCDAADPYTWAGHIHPMVSLRSASDGLRLPCFHIGSRTGILPAFSAFTRGLTVRPAPGDRIFALADGRVIEV